MTTAPVAGADKPALLQVDGLEVVYDRVILALRGLSLELRDGQMVALLGANGAGKSTALKAISNVVGAGRGQVTRGRVRYDGVDVAGAAPAELVQHGLVQVLEGRHCFPHLTVQENLIMGGLVRSPSRAELRRELERIYGLLPTLRDRRHSVAGYTSGGEQQMVALGRALMGRPRLMLLDEPSMGLAPQVIEAIFDIVRTLNRREGVSVLVAEQNATVALEYADTGYILENGRVVSQGTSAALLARDDIRAFYLGDASARRRRDEAPGDAGGGGRAIAGRDRPRRPEYAIR